jgi:hypothetical protein
MESSWTGQAGERGGYNRSRVLDRVVCARHTHRSSTPMLIIPHFRQYGAEDTAGDGAPPIGWTRRHMKAPRGAYLIFPLDLDRLIRTWVRGKASGISKRALSDERDWL